MKNSIYIIWISVLLTGCQPQGNTKGQDPEEMNTSNTKPDKSQGVVVKVQKLDYQRFQHFIEINGSVKAEKEAIVSPETVGQIKKIHVKEGDFVKKGQILVTLNTSITESTIREVRTSLKLAEQTYQKQKELWEQNIGTEMQYLQVKNNKEFLESRLNTLHAQLDMARMKAPFDGIIENISMKTGELASVGREVLHIVNLSELKVYGDVSESYLPYIHGGDWAEISFPVYDGLKLNSKIHRVGQVIDEKSRTFRIEIKLHNKDQKLKPNMITKIRLNDFTEEQALVVPSYIIKQDFTGSFLYVAEKQEGKHIAKKTYVTPGITYNNQTMVIDGLDKDEEVIVVGYNLVSGGTEISPTGTSS